MSELFSGYGPFTPVSISNATKKAEPVQPHWVMPKIIRHYDPEAKEYENVLNEALFRKRDYDRRRGAIRHMGPDEKMHAEYWVWAVMSELAAFRAENTKL